MTEAQLRQAIIDACRTMNATDFNQGTSGNVSARWQDGFLITPSGIPYEALVPQDIVWMAFDEAARPTRLRSLRGNRLADHPLKPSSEWRLHRDIMVARPDVGAVVHAHPPYATALAINRTPIPPVHYMIVVGGGDSIPVADYALYGTEDLSRTTLAAMDGRTACLMANHGLVATGPTVARALWVGREIEALARQYVIARQIGTPVLLTPEEVAASLEKLSTYGLRAKGD